MTPRDSLYSSRVQRRSSDPRRDPSPWPFIAFTGVVFGGGGLLAKALVDDGVDPFTVTWIPFLTAGILATAIGMSRSTLRRDALVPAVILAVTVSTIPPLLFNMGFDRLPAGIVTLLISLGPVFTAVGAHFMFDDESFNRIKSLGLAMAVAGVSILASGSLEGEGSGAALTMVLVGSIVAGGSALLSRLYATRFGAPALIGPQLLLSGLIVVALSVALRRPFAPPQGFAAWHLAVLLLFGLTTYLGFLSMLKANEIGTTGQVSVIGYCIPVFGVVGGLVFFGDLFTTSLAFGGLLIVLAVAVIARGSATGPARGDTSSVSDHPTKPKTVTPLP